MKNYCHVIMIKDTEFNVKNNLYEIYCVYLNEETANNDLYNLVEKKGKFAYKAIVSLIR